jgi:hypothetical protein
MLLDQLMPHQVEGLLDNDVDVFAAALQGARQRFRARPFRTPVLPRLPPLLPAEQIRSPYFGMGKAVEMVLMMSLIAVLLAMAQWQKFPAPAPDCPSGFARPTAPAAESAASRTSP